MNAYEKLIKTMRNEAKNGVSGSSYGLATITDTGLTYNGMDFEDDDILYADYLTKPRLTTLDFLIKKEQPYEETHHNHDWKDKSEYIEPLAAGDVVFGILIKADDDEKFLALCRIGG